ncbi:hypothetical protein PYH37_006213 (plasmid) [Sinorhizobium numidicum]|uniref:Uncharacterized protein n=1 Tax=Sinorhizobium numidicum TaxID=680248 RepID=A0ABY8D6F2_9HYPH|nr:hypothetical protein [Sinorhizobium numidicum]WEX79337.1 hypothetical protein PYH37_006213 [Sinorhizobium numidicum]WEX85292.1 hypothetical protein PYH38_006171 [Sinorhizobium numidicum]
MQRLTSAAPFLSHRATRGGKRYVRAQRNIPRHSIHAPLLHELIDEYGWKKSPTEWDGFVALAGKIGALDNAA